MDEKLQEQLQNFIPQLDVSKYKTTEIRKALQLAMLKGMKGATQQQHLMTPETVALFVGYLAGKVTAGKKNLRMFDPASGTGNLVMAVLDQLETAGSVFASEVDPTLINLAVLNANLQKKKLSISTRTVSARFFWIRSIW